MNYLGVFYTISVHFWIVVLGCCHGIKDDSICQGAYCVYRSLKALFISFFHHIGKGLLIAEHALYCAVINQQVGNKVLVEAPDGGILDRGLKQGMQDMETCLVGSKPGALGFHTAECTHINTAVSLAAPWATLVLETEHLLRATQDEIFHHVLVREPVSSGYRIIEMVFKRVVGLNDPGGAALRSHCMTAHGVNLGYQCHLELGIDLCRRYGSPQATTARTNNNYVCLYRFHASLP